MQHLIGSYECKADSKGRIMLPVALKKQLYKKLKQGFVIKRAVFNKCLELYPISEWERRDLFLPMTPLRISTEKNERLSV